MNVNIIDAREEHVSFVAWVIMTAHRSHLERGMWDFLVGGTEEECLRFLEALSTTKQTHWAHYTNFIIAEVDGKPASAMCGYTDATNGNSALTAAMPEANRAAGRTDEELAAGWQRASSIGYCAPEHIDSAWVVENVATLPEYRRKGLVDRLLQEMLERGRSLGAEVADIGVLIGNDSAQRAYEKAAFTVTGEKCHPEFEAVYHCPGIRTMSRRLSYSSRETICNETGAIAPVSESTTVVLPLAAGLGVLRAGAVRGVET